MVYMSNRNRMISAPSTRVHRKWENSLGTVITAVTNKLGDPMVFVQWDDNTAGWATTDSLHTPEQCNCNA
jgi:hypothetical protein